MTTNTLIRNCKNNTDAYNDSLSEYSQVVSSNINVLKNLSSKTFISSDKDLNDTALYFLHYFQEVLISIHNVEKINNNLPALSITTIDNVIIFIEWIFPYFRIGFSIEKQKEDSSWFLITNKQFQEQTSSGLFDPYHPAEVLNFLIDFVLKNS